MAFDLSILGVEENIPRVNFTEYSGLLQAPPKWGKTTLASLYDNCVLLAFEPGYKAKKINFKKMNSWDDFKEFTSLLEDNREEIGDDIKTLVIDTVDRMYPYVQQYIVRQYNRKKSPDLPRATEIGDIPHGKGWNAADEEFLKEITKVIDMGFTFLFVTHSKVKTINPKDKPQYDVYIPTMPDRCASIVFALVDFIINGERTVVIEDGVKVNKRELIFRANEMANAGSRVGNINERIVFDTEQEAMDKFRETFKQAIEKELNKDGKKVNIDKLSKEQKKQKDAEVKETLKAMDLPKTIKEIKTVMKEKIKENKVTNEEIIKILSDSGIKSPDEIADADTAKKILETFKSK